MKDDVRIVLTRNSAWHFDMTRMMYVRFPRNEAPTASAIPYTCQWEPFLGLLRDDDNRLTVVRPVPWGQGRLRRTDVILSDTHPEMPDIFEEVSS